MKQLIVMAKNASQIQPQFNSSTFISKNVIDLSFKSLVLSWMQFVSFGARHIKERCVLEGPCILHGRGLERVTESHPSLFKVATSSHPLSSILKLVGDCFLSASVSSNFLLKFVSHLFIFICCANAVLA